MAIDAQELPLPGAQGQDLGIVDKIKNAFGLGKGTTQSQSIQSTATPPVQTTQTQPESQSTPSHTDIVKEMIGGIKDTKTGEIKRDPSMKMPGTADLRIVGEAQPLDTSKLGTSENPQSMAKISTDPTYIVKEPDWEPTPPPPPAITQIPVAPQTPEEPIVGPAVVEPEEQKAA